MYYHGAKECLFQLYLYTLLKWPKKIWSEIKRLVPGKNKHSHITCDISANDFNHHFANISNKMNSKFQNFDDNFSEKAQNVFIVFVTKRYLMKIIKYIWDLYLINPIMMGMDLVSLRESTLYTSISLVNVINKSLIGCRWAGLEERQSDAYL